MWALLKDYRISLAAAASVIILVLWIRDWQFSTFVSRAELTNQNAENNERFEKLLLLGQENTRVIKKNFDEFRLYTAVKSVESYEDTLYQYERDIVTDGETPTSAARGEDLRSRLAKAEGYKQCILERKEDCEELLKMWRVR